MPIILCSLDLAKSCFGLFARTLPLIDGFVGEIQLDLQFLDLALQGVNFLSDEAFV
jgi:hypothetical protein